MKPIHDFPRVKLPETDEDVKSMFDNWNSVSGQAAYGIYKIKRFQNPDMSVLDAYLETLNYVVEIATKNKPLIILKQDKKKDQ